MAKPSSHIDWTEGNVNQATISVEPSSGKKEAGWGIGERPPREYMNWLFQNIDEWLKYFEEETDTLISAKNIYDAVIGTGGTHATWEDLIADSDWLAGNIKSILQVSHQTPTAPIALDQDDVNVEFKPGVNLIGGGGATSGFVVSGERVRIMKARFFNFAGGSDKAIEIDSSAKYAIVSNCYFKTCTTEIADSGTTSGLSNNITE